MSIAYCPLFNSFQTEQCRWTMENFWTMEGMFLTVLQCFSFQKSPEFSKGTINKLLFWLSLYEQNCLSFHKLDVTHPSEPHNGFVVRLILIFGKLKIIGCFCFCLGVVMFCSQSVSGMIHLKFTKEMLLDWLEWSHWLWLWP